jgi:hypothetical protein
VSIESITSAMIREDGRLPSAMRRASRCAMQWIMWRQSSMRIFPGLMVWTRILLGYGR